MSRAPAAQPEVLRQRGTFRWTSLIGAGLSATVSKRAARLANTRFWAHHAARLQCRELRRLLYIARSTEFGRRHSFGKIAATADADLLCAFQNSVSLADYEAFRAMMTRMREQAEPDVTWPGIVSDWAQTSGTTGGEKYIPVSREMLKSNFRAALDIFAHSKRFGISLSRLFGGRLLFLGGSTSVETNEHGIRTGDLSGLVTPLIRWPLSQVYTPGPDIALMNHWPSKIDAMARRCMSQDVRMISGMASWSLVLFQRILELAGEHGGSTRTLSQVWPNLTLIVHGGVKYAPFDPRVRMAWSGRSDVDDPSTDLPFRLEVYPASEGFIAMQDTPRNPGLRLIIDNGIFYEFVPLEEIDSPGARAFPCDQVDRGQRYVVVMTTCAGLWRYIIGDVVEFDTIPPAGPARIRIVGRHRHFINAFGENLIVEQIENAVVSAQRATNLVIGEFTAAPVYPTPTHRAGLELLIECADSSIHTRDTISRFGSAFDHSLRSQNVDYNTKRTSDLGMAPPVITTVPMGSVHKWMESRGKLGGQHKAPRCANHREIIDGVRAITSRERRSDSEFSPRTPIGAPA